MCEQKIDEVLNKLNLLIGRVDAMEKNILRFDQRITKFEMNVGKLEAKINEIQSEKSMYAKLNELEQKIKSSLEKLEKIIENLTDLAQKSACNNKKSAMKNELYSKRFNLLIHVVKGEINNVWETNEESEKLAYKFLGEGLQIDNPEAIHFADVHRLPQHSVVKKGKNITRPIIIKLTNSFENIKYLKA